MKVSPRPLLVLHPSRPFLDRLARAAEQRFALQILEDWEALFEGVGQAPPAAIVLVDPYLGRSNGGGPAPELYALLRSFPSATVVAALEVPPGGYRDLWTLGEWGVAEIIQMDEDTSGSALRRRLLSARGQPLRVLLSQELPFPLTGRARTILDAAVETVMTGGHPRDLAKTLSFSPSTLLRWCGRSQLPTPRRLLLWMRVLFAAALLDDPGHSVFSVGLACGYSGDQALRRALRSVVPHTPTELRRKGAFATVSQAFIEELASRRDESAEKR